MRMEDLRALEERYEQAGADLDEFLAGLAKDIKDNPTISPAEMKFKMQQAFTAGAPINKLTALATEMAYRLAMTGIEIEKECGINILGEDTLNGEAKG